MAALPGVERARRTYGAHPAHLVLLLAGFVLTVVAGGALLDEQTFRVAKWFAASAILHDAVFVPVYIGLDSLLVRVWRRRPGRVGWLNFVRIPAAISAIMYLVYYPVISNKANAFDYKTGRSTEVYLGHWLQATAVLFAISAIWYLARVVVVRRSLR
jgi:hypothetical protein